MQVDIFLKFEVACLDEFVGYDFLPENCHLFGPTACAIAFYCICIDAAYEICLAHRVYDIFLLAVKAF